ncbi:Protein of unknown function [Pyronema omphalodes CBS 100304]|uniref:Uncharacterized protein n=1 Tax=Pyronema omphalodes (strain CBS 100304) TaxID=1076935 RepID=U4L5Q5_PYROM|nr:Protein of unknown function [Pyronema omphalodes CBS 100304]
MHNQLMHGLSITSELSEITSKLSGLCQKLDAIMYSTQR